MPGETGILAQSNPAASTLTDIFTVASLPVKVGAIFVANQDTAAVAVRLAVSPGGVAVAASHYLLYDVLVGPGRALILDFRPSGLSLGVGTVIRARADSASVSFNVIAV